MSVIKECENPVIRLTFNEGANVLVSRRDLLQASDYFRGLVASGMRDSTSTDIHLSVVSSRAMSVISQYLKHSKGSLLSRHVIIGYLAGQYNLSLKYVWFGVA